MPYDSRDLATALAALAPAQNASLPLGQAVDPVYQAYQDLIGTPIAKLLGAAPGMSPASTWYQRYWALRDLPTPVVNSILYAPSYGEDERRPSKAIGPGGAEAYAQELSRPGADLYEREMQLRQELGTAQEWRQGNNVAPETSSPWASMWGQAPIFPSPLPPEFQRSPLSLY